MKENQSSNISFINCTPHAIVLNDGQVFEPSGMIPRVAQEISAFDQNRIATQSFGEVQGLPEPKKDTVYIVSAMILSAVPDRKDLVAPATGHPECVRENGRIMSVPGFLRNA